MSFIITEIGLSTKHRLRLSYKHGMIWILEKGKHLFSLAEEVLFRFSYPIFRKRLEEVSMNIVFKHIGERNGDHQVVSAQVSIAEEQGVWNVFWNEPDSAGKSQQAQWYQGMSWDEMLSIFRHGLREKFRIGFRPIVSSDLESTQVLSGKARMTQMLTYYCEEHPSEEVYEPLRAWRREQAAREGKAPYILPRIEYFV